MENFPKINKWVILGWKLLPIINKQASPYIRQVRVGIFFAKINLQYNFMSFKYLHFEMSHLETLKHLQTRIFKRWVQIEASERSQLKRIKKYINHVDE